jgi:hypothetical protein
VGRRESTNLTNANLTNTNVNMPRHDLLQLTTDDLASLTNRGTVKRAQKELESSELQYEIAEEQGDQLVISWSDGIVCKFAAGKSIHDASCSSGALGITRHIVRSVLAYQIRQRESGLSIEEPDVAELIETIDDTPSKQESETDVSNAPAQSVNASGATPSRAANWNPGEFSDADLQERFGAAAVNRARTRFKEGTLVELARGSKPFAIFLDENCFVRFLVPGDLRYVTADCAETALSRFVSMAVWAFRELPIDQSVGLLSLQQTRETETPVDLLDALDEILSGLFVHGIAQSHQSLVIRLARLEPRLRAKSLVWPAELVSELLHQLEMYAAHNALFEPEKIAETVGELLARGRAIRHNIRTVPQLLIRGSRFDRANDINSARYVGIGLGIQARRNQCTINTYFQDADTGIVATIQRVFANTPEKAAEKSEKTFHELAVSSLRRSISLASLAGSQVLLKSGKRTAGSELVLPRGASAFAANPQRFQWEQLKPPLAVERFSDLVSRMEILPPSYLRPRLLTEGIHVVALSRIEDVRFDVVRQQLTANLFDPEEACAKMLLPFHTRGAQGFNQFLELLTKQGETARFISGRVKLVNGVLTFTPFAVVIETDGVRSAIFPWLEGDSISATASPRSDSDAITEWPLGPDELINEAQRDPIREFLTSLNEFIAELLICGLANNTMLIQQLTSELCEHAPRMGFMRIGQILQQLAEELERRRNDLNYEATRAVKLAQQLALIARIEAS